MVESFEPNRIGKDPTKAIQLSAALRSIAEQVRDFGIDDQTREFAGIVMEDVFRDVLPPEVVAVTLPGEVTLNRLKDEVDSIAEDKRESWGEIDLDAFGRDLDKPNWDRYSPLRINPTLS